MSRIDDLYETIGGNRTVNAAIDSFYRRVLKDKSLRHFFDSTDMARLHAGQSMYFWLCQRCSARMTLCLREAGTVMAMAQQEGFSGHSQNLFDDVKRENGLRLRSVKHYS
jgi:hypothetical protein